jgi:hypothetical protein
MLAVPTAVDTPFEAHGHFWRPEDPARRVAGRLTMDRHGLKLRLLDILKPFVPPEGQHVFRGGHVLTDIPLIYGELNDGEAKRPVTLVDAKGFVLPVPLVEGDEEYDCQWALLEGHVAADLFQGARIGFDVALAWANPEPLTEELFGESVAVDASATVLGECEIGSHTIRLVRDVTRRYDVVAGEASLTLRVLFDVSGPSLSVAALLSQFVRPLQDLLIVALGVPIRLTSLDLSEAVGGLPVRLAGPVTQPEESEPLNAASARSYNSPALATIERLPVSLLPAWFELRDLDYEAITTFTGPYFAPFIYSEHQYASTYQAAESLARRRFETRDLSPEERDARFGRIDSALSAAGVPAEDHAWATNILKTRNDKSQQQLIRELVQEADDVGVAILDAIPNFPKVAAVARGAVSHGGVRSKGEDESARDALWRRVWAGEILRWLVRYTLLKAIGVDPATMAQHTLNCPRFLRALEELKLLT